MDSIWVPSSKESWKARKTTIREDESCRRERKICKRFGLLGTSCIRETLQGQQVIWNLCSSNVQFLFSASRWPLCSGFGFLSQLFQKLPVVIWRFPPGGDVLIWKKKESRAKECATFGWMMSAGFSDPCLSLGFIANKVKTAYTVSLFYLSYGSVHRSRHAKPIIFISAAIAMQTIYKGNICIIPSILSGSRATKERAEQKHMCIGGWRTFLRERGEEK